MGWLQNLLNKITKKRLPEPEVENQSYAEVPDNMNQYNFDVSNMGSKTSKQVELENAIQYAKNGGYPQQAENLFRELTFTELYACSSIGNNMKHGWFSEKDIENVGGIEELVSRMVKEAEKTAEFHQYMPSTSFKFVDNANDIMNTMKYEQEMARRRESVSLPDTDLRRGTLNQLYNTAYEMLSKGYNYVDEAVLLNQASMRGGTQIQLGGENPYVEAVDLYAAMSLARNVVAGYTNINTLEPADVINEMSVDAKDAAVNILSFTPDKAKECLKHPNESVQKLLEDKSKKETSYEQIY